METEVILTNFNGVSNIGLEKLHNKSVDNKVQLSQIRCVQLFLCWCG